MSRQSARCESTSGEIVIPTPEQMMSFHRVADQLIAPDADAPHVDLAAIKALVCALGVNQRGWRLLADYWETLISPLRGSLIDGRRPLGSLENLCIYLRLLQQCEMDVLPPADFVRAWAQMTIPAPYSHLRDVPVGLFRAAWKECIRLQGSTSETSRFLRDELPAVAHWFFATDRVAAMDDGQLKRGWRHLRWHYDAWKERCCHSHEGKKDWEPLLDASWVISGVRVEELVSADAVTEEGQIMRHCIANSIPGCEDGEYRVFSLRDPISGERIVTVGLMLVDGLWTIEDQRAQDNEEPDSHFERIANQVEAMCRNAHDERWHAEHGAILREISRLFQVAADQGFVAFSECAPFVLRNLPRRSRKMGAALQLEELQGAYVGIAAKYAADPRAEMLAALSVESIDELGDDRQLALFFIDETSS